MRVSLPVSSTTVKRAFDLLGASIGLLVIAPLMLVILVAIKLDSRAPAFFPSSVSCAWVGMGSAFTCSSSAR